LEHCLSKIVTKPSDYKLCPACSKVNWYENEECYNCNENIKDVEFMTEEEMNKFAEEEYGFWKKEGYTEKEIDDLLVEV